MKMEREGSAQWPRPVHSNLFSYVVSPFEKRDPMTVTESWLPIQRNRNVAEFVAVEKGRVVFSFLFVTDE
jgi:hypothetical protein